MQYEIEVGGRLKRVTVNRMEHGFAVSVDGRLHEVAAVRVDAYTLSLIVGKASVVDAVITPDTAADKFIVHVGGMPVSVALNGRRRHGARKEGSSSGSGSLRLAAPMAGKVLRVLVAVGDTVLARQPLVVVEAMKMENELRAGREGTVVEIHAREGTSVDAGAVLIVIQ